MKLSSFVLAGVSNGQLIPGLNLMPQSIQNTIVSSIQTQVVSLAATAGVTELNGISVNDIVSVEALTTVLTSPQTSNPLEWDEDFLNAVLPDPQYVTYVQTAQTFANDAATMIADAGISDLEDLSSENVQGLLSTVISSDPNLEEAFMAALNPENDPNLTLEALTGDLAAGFDALQNYDITDPQTYADPAVLTNLLSDVVGDSTVLSTLVTDDLIHQAATLTSSNLAQVLESDLIEGSGEGFDINSLVSDLTQPLEVCYSTLEATRKLLTPSLQGILNFDRNGFIANLGQLLSDGIQCGKNYAEFSGTDISAYEQYLDYTSYVFVGIEKYFKITDGLEEVKDEYSSFKNNFENYMEVLYPVLEDSYIKYAERLLDAINDVLIIQAEDFILASVNLYNSALSDIPVVMNYRIPINTVIDHLAAVEVFVDVVNNELKSLGNFGGQMLENLIRQRVEKMRNKSNQVNNNAQTSNQVTAQPTVTQPTVTESTSQDIQEKPQNVQQQIVSQVQNQVENVQNWVQKIPDNENIKNAQNWIQQAISNIQNRVN